MQVNNDLNSWLTSISLGINLIESDQDSFSIELNIFAMLLNGLICYILILVIENLKYNLIKWTQKIEDKIKNLKLKIFKNKDKKGGKNEKRQKKKATKITYDKPDNIEIQDLNYLITDKKDVEDEAIRVLNNAIVDPFKAMNITQKYSSLKTPVLDNVTCSVNSSEVFGIIGPNGAGKSTLLNAVTMIIPRTAGTIKVSGRELTHRSYEEFINFGICPQFDALWDSLTVREHLFIFGTMKGYQRWELEGNIHFITEILKMKKQIAKTADILSQGNRRKLSLMNSLISSPKFLFLDEPSTGLDVSSKKSFWNLINTNLIINSSSVFLTTQSMHEAENLAHKIGNFCFYV